MLVTTILVPVGVASAAEVPTVEAALDPAAPDGDNDWYTSPINLSLTSDDAAANLRWRESGDADWVGYDAPVSFDQDGNYDLEYQAVTEGEGGPTAIEIIAGPDGQDIFTPADSTVEVGGEVTFTRESGFHNVVISNPSGEEVGRSEMNSSWTTYEFVPTEPGVYEFICEPHASTGMVGTLTVLPAAEDVESEIGQVSFGLDQTAPQTTATLDGEGAGSVFIDQVSVALDAQDATSGVAQTEYRVDGGSIQGYSDAVEITDAGEFSLEFRSTDQAGNVEDWQQVNFEVVVENPDAPSVTVALDPAAPNGDNGWYTSVSMVLSSDNDDASLLWRYAGAGAWSRYTDPVDFGRDGELDVEYRAATGWTAPRVVDVAVGEGGSLFTPDVISVLEGGTINYELVRGRHNVVTVDEAGEELASSGAPSNEWDTYTFDVPEGAGGTYYVYCQPHADTSDPDPANWTGMVARIDVVPDAVQVDVGDGGRVFTPDEITVEADGRVDYTLVSGRHNVVTVDAAGEEIATSGAPANDWDVYSFDAPSEVGTYYVYCAPHADTSDPDPANWTGMVARMDVTERDSVAVDVGDGGRVFTPDEITVEADGRVDYTLVSGRHNVVTVDAAGEEIATSGAPANDWDVYSFDAPNKAGTYYVYCAPHADTSDPDPANWTGMVAQLDVTDEEVSSQVRQLSFNLDSAAPRSSVTVEGEQDGDVYLDSATVSFSARDSASGIAQTQWRYADETDHVAFDEPITIVGSGTSTLEYRSVDNAGNVEDWKSVVIEVESSLPVCAQNQGVTSFPDAPGSGHQFFIDCLAALEIVGGFKDGTYRPADAVTREQLASFVVRAVENVTDVELEAGGELFPDVAPGSTHGQAIYKLRNAGVLQGYEDGTFRPTAEVSRDQTARYVVNTLEALLDEELPTSGARFPDVTSTQYVADIDKLVTAEVIGGFADGTFGPRLSVTRGQMARFIGNSLDLFPNA